MNTCTESAAKPYLFNILLERSVERVKELASIFNIKVNVIGSSSLKLLSILGDLEKDIAYLSELLSSAIQCASPDSDIAINCQYEQMTVSLDIVFITTIDNQIVLPLLSHVLNNNQHEAFKSKCAELDHRKISIDIEMLVVEA